MRESVCFRFFGRYLGKVSRGDGDLEFENPTRRFNRDALGGRYNELSDHEYKILFEETKSLSAFWDSQKSRKASDIFLAALENIDIDEKSLEKIAAILSKCYFSTKDATGKREKFAEMKDCDGKLALEEYFPDLDNPEEKSLESRKNKRRMIENALKEYIPGDEGECDVDLDSPREIDEWIAKRIYGQREAVRAAAMLLYNHRKGRKRNLLFVGPTGCGKTEIWRVCKQLYPNIHIIDSTRITQEGWKGEFKIANIFDGMSPYQAERAIMVFDEFDKLCEPRTSSYGENYGAAQQNELLKLIEGTTLPLRNISIDTSKISFVFCGSFERLTMMKAGAEGEKEQSIGFGADPKKKEAYSVYHDTLQPADLVKYAGMRQETAGRINQIVQLSPMTASAFEAILEDEKMSPLHQLERQYSIKLSLDKDMEEKLVQEAEKTRMGVRYLRSRIQQMLDDQMFRDCEQEEYMLGA